MRIVWIVQDKESHLFLYPVCGDVGYTPWVKEAGFFYSRDEAIETAVDHCTEGFDLFSFGCLFSDE
jgi:hypothetical protein